MNETRDLEQFYADRLAEKVVGVAESLRRIADSIEREAKEIRAHDYADTATQVIHEVTWGVANLSLGQLVTCTADATRERGAKQSV